MIDWDSKKESLQELELMKAIEYEVKTSSKSDSSGWVHIKETKKIGEILSTLGDPLTRQILIALNKKPHTALDLMEEIPDAPKTSLYRKMKDLEEQGVIKVDSFEQKENKKVAVYKSTIMGIQINMKDEIDLFIHIK